MKRILYVVWLFCMLPTALFAETAAIKSEYISFTRCTKQGCDLWMVSTDGKCLSKLSSRTGGLSSPSEFWVSPIRLVYTSGDELWLMDINSKQTKQITHESKALDEHLPGESDGFCTLNCVLNGFNPSRNEIYYYLSDEPCAGLPRKNRVIDLSTLESKDMTIPASWSFLTDAMGDWLLGSTPSGLAAFNLKTKTEKVLTNYKGTSGGDGQAVLSPDGKLLAFTRDMEIYLLDLRTLQTRRLAGKGQRPMWSPDGKQIIFKNTIIHKTPPLNQYGEIYITDLKGNQETLISGKDYGKGPLSLGPLGWTQAGEIVWLQTNFSVHGESPRQRTDLKLIDPHTKQIRVLAEDIMSSAIWRQPGQAPTIDMNKQAP